MRRERAMRTNAPEDLSALCRGMLVQIPAKSRQAVRAARQAPVGLHVADLGLDGAASMLLCVNPGAKWVNAWSAPLRLDSSAPRLRAPAPHHPLSNMCAPRSHARPNPARALELAALIRQDAVAAGPKGWDSRETSADTRRLPAQSVQPSSCRASGAREARVSSVNVNSQPASRPASRII